MIFQPALPGQLGQNAITWADGAFFVPASRASPVARAGISSKRAGPASRAESCNRKDENTYNL